MIVGACLLAAARLLLGWSARFAARARAHGPGYVHDVNISTDLFARSTSSRTEGQHRESEGHDVPRGVV
jgi:hypothetical protein